MRGGWRSRVQACRRLLLSSAAVAMPMVAVFGCAQFGNDAAPQSVPEPVPRIAIFRGRLVSKSGDPYFSGSACYEISEVFCSESPLERGVAIQVRTRRHQASVQTGRDVPQGDARCWPADAYLVLTQAGSEEGRLAFDPVTEQCDRWILPVNEDTEAQVRSSTRQQVL